MDLLVLVIIWTLMGGSRVVATLVTVTSYTRKCGHGQRNGRETGGRDEWRIDGWKD